MKSMWSRTGVVAGLALLLIAGLQLPLAAQSGRARVLVAVFQTAGGVDSDFGEAIAERLRERVDRFDLFRAVPENEVERATEQFDLDPHQMDLISWRQLASRLDAQLVVYGEVTRDASSGNRVDAVFVESGRGEQTEVPDFSVSGDDGGSAREVADRIATALEEHVEFLRARLNCQDYLSGNQFADAIRNCDRALSLRPNSPQALYLRGQIEIEQEQWENAIGYLERVLEQNATHESALQSLAYAHAQAGNTDRATDLYRRYLEFNPDDQQVRLSVAFNLAQAGAYREAMGILRNGLERDSTSAALWKYLGDVAIRQALEGDAARIQGGSTITDTAAVRTAIEAYERFSGLQPDSVSRSTYLNLVRAHLQLEQVEAASRTLGEALRAFPEEASLWSLRADIASQRNDLRGAIGAMDSVIALEPERQGAYFKRGVFRLRNGDQEGAMADFRRAVETGTDPNEIGRTLFANGFRNYYDRGRFLDAVRMFQTALEFASTRELENQLHFFTGYSYYRRAVEIDSANAEEEACEPAQRAQELFSRVLPHIDQAGNYQAQSQEQIRQAVDVQLYRQEQIQKKSCTS